MKSVVCPISTERVDSHVVRLTGLMMACMIALYLVTGNLIFIVAILIDYFLRAFTKLSYSPLSWVAAQIVRGFKMQPKQIDKAPKIFAARVGWLMALLTAVFHFIYPPAAIAIAATLMIFALLESVFNFCAGCVIYGRIVLPLMGESS